MKSFNPIILGVKFDWYLPSGSGEDFNFVYVFSLFRNYLPSEKLTSFHLNKLDFPSTKNALCQVRLNLVQCFLRRRFLNFVNEFSLFCYYLLLNPIFVQILVEIGPVAMEKKFKMWKVYRQTGRRTIGDQKSPLDLSANVSYKVKSQGKEE